MLEAATAVKSDCMKDYGKCSRRAITVRLPLQASMLDTTLF